MNFCKTCGLPDGYEKLAASLRSARDRYKAALEELKAVLGPKTPECVDCPGCEVEWDDALLIITAALTPAKDVEK